MDFHQWLGEQFGEENVSPASSDNTPGAHPPEGGFNVTLFDGSTEHVDASNLPNAHAERLAEFESRVTKIRARLAILYLTAADVDARLREAFGGQHLVTNADAENRARRGEPNEFLVSFPDGSRPECCSALDFPRTQPARREAIDAMVAQIRARWPKGQ